MWSNKKRMMQRWLDGCKMLDEIIAFKFGSSLARRQPRRTCREETRDLEKGKLARSYVKMKSLEAFTKTHLAHECMENRC